MIGCCLCVNGVAVLLAVQKCRRLCLLALSGLNQMCLDRYVINMISYFGHIAIVWCLTCFEVFKGLYSLIRGVAACCACARVVARLCLAVAAVLSRLYTRVIHICVMSGSSRVPLPGAPNRRRNLSSGHSRAAA